MRALTTTEIDQVAGAQDTWRFSGEPVSVANMEAIKNSFYDRVSSGALGGAMGGRIGGLAGVTYGAIGGALIGATSWLYSVTLSTPMVTYTPMITITEIEPGGDIPGGGGC